MSGAAGARGLPEEGPRDLEHEFDLVRSAIALIATGGARRVTLVGLPFDARALHWVATNLARSDRRRPLFRDGRARSATARATFGARSSPAS